MSNLDSWTIPGKQIQVVVIGGAVYAVVSLADDAYFDDPYSASFPPGYFAGLGITAETRAGNQHPPV